MRGDGRAHAIVTHLENTPRASILGELNRIPVVHLLHNTFEKSKTWLVKGTPALAVYNTDWMRADVTAWWRIHRGDRPMPWGISVHPPVAVADYEAAPGDSITLINLTEEKGARVFYALAERMPRRKFLGVVGATGSRSSGTTCRMWRSFRTLLATAWPRTSTPERRSFLPRLPMSPTVASPWRPCAPGFP